MKWIIDGKEFETASDASYYITENLNDDIYDEMLDECYGDIDICGISYCASIALYRVDEIAYNCGKNDYYDGLASDLEYEIDNMTGGETDTFYDFEIECIEEDEDEDEDDDE